MSPTSSTVPREDRARGLPKRPHPTPVRRFRLCRLPHSRPGVRSRGTPDRLPGGRYPQRQSRAQRQNATPRPEVLVFRGRLLPPRETEMPERQTVAKLIPLHPEEFARITVHTQVPSGLPPWLAALVREAAQETDTLRVNGAEQAATARTVLVTKLIGAAQAWLDAELDPHAAARETGRCEETIRRAVRHGTIPDRRPNPRGRHRIRRGDLQKLAPPPLPMPMPRTSPDSGPDAAGCLKFTLCIDSPYGDGAHPGCHDGCHACWRAFTGSRPTGRSG